MSARVDDVSACRACGAALTANVRRCPSSGQDVSDPELRFEQWTRVMLMVLCIAGAVVLAGATVLSWVRAKA